MTKKEIAPRIIDYLLKEQEKPFSQCNENKRNCERCKVYVECGLTILGLEKGATEKEIIEDLKSTIKK